MTKNNGIDIGAQIEMNLATEKTAWDAQQQIKKSRRPAGDAHSERKNLSDGLWEAFPYKEPFEIKVTSIDIPFWDIVTLLVKLALAAIPAGIILSILWYMIIRVLGSL